MSISRWTRVSISRGARIEVHLQREERQMHHDADTGLLTLTLATANGDTGTIQRWAQRA